MIFCCTSFCLDRSVTYALCCLCLRVQVIWHDDDTQLETSMAAWWPMNDLQRSQSYVTRSSVCDAAEVNQMCPYWMWWGSYGWIGQYLPGVNKDMGDRYRKSWWVEGDKSMPKFWEMIIIIPCILFSPHTGSVLIFIMIEWSENLVGALLLVSSSFEPLIMWTVLSRSRLQPTV